MNNNYIYTYTRQNAIEDGIFKDVTEVAKNAGFRVPTALTTNLYDAYIKKESEGETLKRLDAFLLVMYYKIAAKKTKDRLITTHVLLDNAHVEVWIALEALTPDDPNPALTFMLPSDY